MSVRDVLAFRKIPTTILIVLIYLAIFLSVSITDNLPPVPDIDEQLRLGLDLSGAYDDLHIIAGSAHPYNSHRNDEVRSHILARLQSITQDAHFAHIADDGVSNATFVSHIGNAAYFEGTNVLVKIDGLDSSMDSEALLFSAHYDSVSTAPGATDNGIGVATSIQLVKYFTTRRPERTIIFNFNNGEEDGLKGAHAFLEHPWSKVVKSFVNLEGAGAGGRPILLRSSTMKLAQAYSQAAHPQGNSIAADMFNRRAIKSATDYTIYTDASMDGLDFVFYKPRSKYHTKDDSIPSLGGSAALWAMMETTLTIAKTMTNKYSDESGGNDMPVYFDLFGEAMAVLSLRTALIINIVFLICGPLLVAALIFVCYSTHKLHWSRTGWGRYPIAIIVTGASSSALCLLYMYLNPFTVYSSALPVFLSCLGASYITLYCVMELFTYFRPVPQQKSAILLEAYIFWWAVLVVHTVAINRYQISGLSIVTFFHASTLAAFLLSIVEHLELPAATAANGEQAPLLEDDEDGAMTEETPLISPRGRVVKEEEVDEDNQMGLWPLQVLLATVMPVILTAEIGALFFNALPQTLADGSSSIVVYSSIAALAFLTVLSIAPFIHKMHYSIFVITIVAFAATAIYNIFAFPFTDDAALKIFFQQTIDLSDGENNVSLTGAKAWLKDSIIEELPSSWSHTVDCSSSAVSGRLVTCSLPGITPAVAPGTPHEWITLNATLKAPGSAVILLSGSNSRNCKLYFDRNVTNVGVSGSSGKIQDLYPFPSYGIDAIELWSRTWNRTFEVEVGWDGSVGLSGRAACEWAEDGIPALDEVMNFLPRWVRVTKYAEGLVEGYIRFSL